MTDFHPLRPLLCVLLLCSAAAQAHHHGEHDDDQPPVPAAATPAQAPPPAAADAPRVELVAERRGPDVLLYVDDYASNAPLDGLQVSVRSGAALLQAAPAGEGTYRIPGDLIDGTRDQTLVVEIHGGGIDAQLQAALPVAVAETAPPPAPAGRGERLLALALGAALLAALAWALLRRRRGAA